MTKLEAFLKCYGIKPSAVARKSGYSRQHLLRIRLGSMEPTRRCIAAIVVAVRELSPVPVQPEDLFELAGHVPQAVPLRADPPQVIASDGARDIVKHLLAESPGKWRRVIKQAGGERLDLCRAIVETARETVDADARRALMIANLAKGVLATLLPPSREVVLLRVRAEIECALAEINLGGYAAAEGFLQAAENILWGQYRSVSILGQVWYVRASVLLKKGGYDESLDWLARAEFLYSLSGDDRRAAQALVLRGVILYERGEVVAARNLFVQALRSLKRQRDAYSIASVRVNLGRCEADLGRIEEGRMLLMGARQAFQQLKAPSEVARAKAGEARILALQLQDPGGIQELYAVRNTFDALGMPNESALVALDITEALLLSADPR